MRLSPEYIAGLFDGEGSVGLYLSGRNYEPSLRIELRADKATVGVLNDLCKQYGVTVNITKRGACRFSLTSASAIKRFIADVLPFTRLKTPQLILLRSWLDTKTYGFRVAQLIKSHKQRRR